MARVLAPSPIGKSVTLEEVETLNSLLGSTPSLLTSFPIGVERFIVKRAIEKFASSNARYFALKRSSAVE